MYFYLPFLLFVKPKVDESISSKLKEASVIENKKNFKEALQIICNRLTVSFHIIFKARYLNLKKLLAL